MCVINVYILTDYNTSNCTCDSLQSKSLNETAVNYRGVKSLLSLSGMCCRMIVQFQGCVKRRYLFPEGTSLVVTPLGKRAAASASESEGMTMTLSPGFQSTGVATFF